MAVDPDHERGAVIAFDWRVECPNDELVCLDALTGRRLQADFVDLSRRLASA